MKRGVTLSLYSSARQTRIYPAINTGINSIASSTPPTGIIIASISPSANTIVSDTACKGLRMTNR